jgi:hypothetical protein
MSVVKRIEKENFIKDIKENEWIRIIWAPDLLFSLKKITFISSAIIIDIFNCSFQADLSHFGFFFFIKILPDCIPAI